MEKSNKKVVSIVTFSVFLLIIGLLLAITLGAAHIGIFDMRSNKLNAILVRDVRVPRALCVIFTGGILGMTGAMLQGVTRNPIAEPAMLGVSQGATLIIAIFFAVGISATTTNTMFAALIGAVFSGSIVMSLILGRKSKNSIIKILLAGTAMSTFFISLTTIVGLLSNQAQFIAFWVAGGFRDANWSDFKLISIMSVLGITVAIRLSNKINLLSLGDEVAIGLGENPEKIRLITVLAIIPLCAAAVAVGKNVGFVGLIVPQLSRKILGEDYRKNIPMCFLLGAVLLTYSDIAARMIFSPYEIPIGVFTALIGVPFFIAAARREQG